MAIYSKPCSLPPTFQIVNELLVRMCGNGGGPCFLIFSPLFQEAPAEAVGIASLMMSSGLGGLPCTTSVPVGNVCLSAQLSSLGP